MWPFSSGEGKTVLLVDMGSASVGAAAVVLREDTAPKVAYNTRIPLSIQGRINPALFLKVMTSYLDQAIEKVANQAPRHLQALNAPESISAVEATFSSPWFVTSLHEARQTFDQPFPVNQDLIDSVTRNAIDAFQQNSAEDIFDGKRFSTDIEVIEHENTSISVNGYETRSPHGKTAHDLTVGIFMSALSRGTMERVDDTIAQQFATERLTYHTSPVVVSRAAGQIIEDVSQALLIDIGGDRTDISAVKNHGIKEVYSIGFGTNDLVRLVAYELEIGTELANSFLNLHMHDKLEDELAGKMTRLIGDKIDHWLTECKDLLESLKEDQTWTRQALVYGVGGAEVYFVDALRNGAQHTNGNKTEPTDLAITELDEQALQPYVTFSEGTEFDSFIALEALYARALHGVMPTQSSQKIAAHV